MSEPNRFPKPTENRTDASESESVEPAAGVHEGDLPPPEFYEEMAKDCYCCSCCRDVPCAGVCAGGLCDGFRCRHDDADNDRDERWDDGADDC